jgi:predicted GH43/DUF377 family glycosyl hydrolase
MKSALIKSLRKLQRSETALVQAREDRNAARVDLTTAIYDAMKANRINRGHVRQRLPGWSSEKIGNILHLHQGVKTEAEWLQLIEAVAIK